MLKVSLFVLVVHLGLLLTAAWEPDQNSYEPIKCKFDYLRCCHQLYKVGEKCYNTTGYEERPRYGPNPKYEEQHWEHEDHQNIIPDGPCNAYLKRTTYDCTLEGYTYVTVYEQVPCKKEGYKTVDDYCGCEDVLGHDESCKKVPCIRKVHYEYDAICEKPVEKKEKYLYDTYCYKYVGVGDGYDKCMEEYNYGSNIVRSDYENAHKGKSNGGGKTKVINQVCNPIYEYKFECFPTHDVPKDMRHGDDRGNGYVDYADGKGSIDGYDDGGFDGHDGGFDGHDDGGDIDGGDIDGGDIDGGDIDGGDIDGGETDGGDTDGGDIDGGDIDGGDTDGGNLDGGDTDGGNLDGGDDANVDAGNGDAGAGSQPESTPNPSSQNSDPNNDGGLSGGQIAGITIGALAGTALIMLAAFGIHKKYIKKDGTSEEVDDA